MEKHEIEIFRKWVNNLLNENNVWESAMCREEEKITARINRLQRAAIQKKLFWEKRNSMKNATTRTTTTNQ